MVFNSSTTWDFEPNFEVDGTVIQVVKDTKLLGIHLTFDLKWKKHVNMTTKQAYARLWILKRLVNLGARRDILVDTYIKQVRTVLEYGVPVWHSSLTLQQKSQLERVQKTSMNVILGREYQSASSARKVLKLHTLEKRRINICLKFGLKAAKNKNHTKWFKASQNGNLNLRRKLPK